MAGSKSWRLYTADNGSSYSVFVDESNSRAVLTGGAGQTLLPARLSNFPLPPKGLQKRYVNTYNITLPTQKRRFFIGTPELTALALAVGATITAETYPGVDDTLGETTTWVITSYRGEKSQTAPGFAIPDTGLTDETPLN